jgi:3-oxoacyl-[acyl-carrier-protein] synthase II
MSLRSPVITGTGIICAAGGNLREVWEATRAGQTGLGPLILFSSVRYASHLVGQVRQDVGRLCGQLRGSRSDKLAWIAAREAVQSAGLGSSLDPVQPERAGVLLGSTVGGMLGTEQFLIRLLREQRRRFGLLRFHECAGAADLCSRQLGARGPCATVSTACSAGAMAIAAAAELIEAGEADLMLAGGSDSLCRLTLNGFGSLLLLDPGGCRPFDARRAGISLGEGAAMLILEAEETARARGAKILARLTGWGASCDAWHATAPHPEGRGAFAAMQQALQRAAVQASEIGFVSAHGTGTPDNDVMEVKALRRLFGGRLPPVASVKGFFGHTLAASGPIQAVLCVQALQEQSIPPNLGFEQVDPRLGLEPVREFRAHPVSHVLSNSFGFGGNNIALVFSRASAIALEKPSNGAVDNSSDEPDTVVPTTPSLHHSITPPPQAPLAVLGVGVISAAGATPAEVFAAFRHGGATLSFFDAPATLPPGRARVYACGEFGADQLIDPGKRRKLNRLQQMALVTARQSLPAAALASASRERICLALGTGLGSLNDTAAFVENLVLKDERAPRPLFFANSVHNSLASQVAIEMNLAGLNSTPVQREICFEAALWQGASEVAGGRADFALVGAADELNQYALAAGLRWGWWDEQTPDLRPFARLGEQQPRSADIPAARSTRRPLPGEGCTLFSLARADRALPSQPLAWVSGVRIGRFATTAGGQVDADVEAQWVQATLARAGVSLNQLDLLLTGANGWPPLDGAYADVAAALSRLAGRQIPCGAFKHCCGEHHSASAFGFLAAIGLVRGEILPSLCCPLGNNSAPPDRPCRMVVLYTLSLGGAKGLCCVRA